MQISRRETRKSERRATIVEVARESFFENGYAATTMSEIAARLGGSKGTLWSYFPSKEDLFAAVLDEATADFKKQLSQVLERHEDVHSTLTRLCLHVVNKLTSPPAICLHRLINGECGRFPEIGRIFFERGPKNVKAIVAAYLDQCIEEGSIQEVDTIIAAGNLLALCMCGSHQRLLFNMIEAATPAQIQADADNAVDVFLRAYGTGHSGSSTVSA